MTTRFIWLRRAGLGTEQSAETVAGRFDIDISLEEGSMDNHLAYDTVSYMWDGQVPDQPILCCGKVMLVTRNCHKILSCMMQNEARDGIKDESREARAIWIDAICIDQLSMAERNYQVALMSDIYRNA